MSRVLGSAAVIALLASLMDFEALGAPAEHESTSGDRVHVRVRAFPRYSGSSIDFDPFDNNDLFRPELQRVLDESLDEKYLGRPDDSILADKGNYLASEEEVEEYIRLLSQLEAAESSQLGPKSEAGESRDLPIGQGVASVTEANEQARSGGEDEECAICLEALSETTSVHDPVVLDECNHAFHYNCLKTWFDEIKQVSGRADQRLSGTLFARFVAL